MRAGDDTDSNAAMAGQVLGALLGSTAIPSEPFDRIRDAVEMRQAGAAFARFATRDDA